MIGPLGKSALFTSAGKPVTVEVSGQVGGWTVQAIEAANVTLSGPDGVRQLRITFDLAEHTETSTAVFATEAGLLWDNFCGRVHGRANGRQNRFSTERCSALAAAISLKATPLP